MREIDGGGADLAVDCVGVLASATRDVTGANSAESFYGIASAVGYSGVSSVLSFSFISVLFKISFAIFKFIVRAHEVESLHRTRFHPQQVYSVIAIS